MVKNMEIKNLITFIQVAEVGNFTKAAELLGYSQSTISFQIKQLEDELGCLLFERINHTITLTEKGHELLTYAHKICALTNEFKENITQIHTCSGHIHIVTPDSICENMMYSNYINFHNLYPSISFTFSTADTLDMFQMLDQNKADLIITLDNRIYKKDYIIAKEEPLKMHFVTNASSPFANAKNLSINDIIHEPFILTERGQGYRRVFDRELAKKSLEISPILEIGRTDIITSLISQSNMISFLPKFVTEQMVLDGHLAYLDICDVNIEIWKQLIYHKNKWISKSLNTFIEYVKQFDFNN